jgi:hypothetical protein
MKKIFMIVAVLLLAGLFTGRVYAEELVCEEGMKLSDITEEVCEDVLTGEECVEIEHPAECTRYWPWGSCRTWEPAWTEEVCTPVYEEVCEDVVIGQECVIDEEYVAPEEPEEPVVVEDTGTYVAPKNVFHRDTRCLDAKPIVPTWSRFIPNMLTWSAVGGNKVEVRFGFSQTELPYSVVFTNDGHEAVGLGTVTGWWGGYWKMRTINGCRVSDWTPVLSNTGSW